METIQFISITPEKLKSSIVAEVKELFSLFQKPDDSTALMTREEAAEFLKISLPTLWLWTKNKKLTAYAIGNRVYYKKGELLSALTPLKK